MNWMMLRIFLNRKELNSKKIKTNKFAIEDTEGTEGTEGTEKKELNIYKAERDLFVIYIFYVI